MNRPIPDIQQVSIVTEVYLYTKQHIRHPVSFFKPPSCSEGFGCRRSTGGDHAWKLGMRFELRVAPRKPKAQMSKGKLSTQNPDPGTKDLHVLFNVVSSPERAEEGFSF